MIMPEPPELPDVDISERLRQVLSERPAAKATALPGDGIHLDVPHAEYHARRIGVVSKSALDLIARSPAHYKAWIDGAPEEDTPALAFGAAFHCALLEPERFARDYAVEPDFGDCRRKDNKAARDEWRAAHAGATYLSDEDSAAIDGMIGSVRRHPLAGKMIRDGAAEVTLRWTDEETGLSCKARADYYVQRLAMAADVKSSLDARYDAFRRDVGKYGYHRQDALYRQGFAAVGEPVRHFVFIVVEKVIPFAVAIYALGGDATARAHGSVRRDINTMARCMSANDWPGYTGSIQTIDDLPPWVA